MSDSQFPPLKTPKNQAVEKFSYWALRASFGGAKLRPSTTRKREVEPIFENSTNKVIVMFRKECDEKKEAVGKPTDSERSPRQRKPNPPRKGRDAAEPMATSAQPRTKKAKPRFSIIRGGAYSETHGWHRSEDDRAQ
jgi:hypothetical protein